MKYESGDKMKETKNIKIVPMQLTWKCPYCNHINSESRFGGLVGKIRSQCSHCGKIVILIH